MCGSIRLKPSELGGFLLLIAAASLAVGTLRREMILVLMGGIFLGIPAYCFLGIILLAALCRKRARALSAKIAPGQTGAGKNAEAVLTFAREEYSSRSKSIFRLPGILVRYKIEISTKDGRSIIHFFDPFKAGAGVFPAPERGAFFSAYDELCIMDSLGLFRLAFRIPQEESQRLLVLPAPAESPPELRIHSGGSEERRETRFQRTDNLIEHRPYVPGDDPRRINWKLYGHLGDLFIREGEREPPPHSKLSILIDTSTDKTIFSDEESRLAVDMLCENALALALEYGERGFSAGIGYTGGKVLEGSAAELTAHLARPAALPLSTAEDLPQSPDRALIILALPRDTAAPAALDRFLQKREKGQTLDLLFLSDSAVLAEHGETCARLYSQKAGVHTR